MGEKQGANKEAHWGRSNADFDHLIEKMSCQLCSLLTLRPFARLKPTKGRPALYNRSSPRAPRKFRDRIYLQKIRSLHLPNTIIIRTRRPPHGQLSTYPPRVILQILRESLLALLQGREIILGAGLAARRLSKFQTGPQMAQPTGASGT